MFYFNIYEEYWSSMEILKFGSEVNLMYFFVDKDKDKVTISGRKPMENVLCV